MSNLERRVVEQAVEVRANEDGTYGVSGYAAVFDRQAHGEVIKPSAFKRSVRMKDDVKLKANHSGMTLARTSDGTLKLSVDEIGLRFDAPRLDMRRSDVSDVVYAVETRTVDQCSFAGYFTDAPVNRDGVREVRECKLTDVSIVSDPWYEDTSVSVTGNRNVDRQLVEIRSMPDDERSLLLGALSQPVEPEPPAEEREAEPDERPSLSVAEARALMGLPAA